MEGKSKKASVNAAVSLKISCLYLLLLTFAFVSPLYSQRVAILTPDRSETSRSFSERLGSRVAERLRVLDTDLAESAYFSVSPEAPFNLTIGEVKRIGAAIGCDAFILLRSANQRRSAFGRKEYYEAYAFIYVVSSRTGRLIRWMLPSYEAARPEQADKQLNDAILLLSREISAAIESAVKREINEPAPPAIEEVPEENSPLAKNFRPPVPYLRIKPEYTSAAAFYEITATVESLVDLDAAGEIKRLEIVRWAGFGLDESVEASIRKMNWRPAMRNGKPLPMRFLLRYNFKKLEKDTPARQ
jgi:hypothetical protein